MSALLASTSRMLHDGQMALTICTSSEISPAQSLLAAG